MRTVATMDNELLEGFYLRDVRIEPLTGQVSGPDGSTHLPSKSVEVLLCLAKHPRHIVTRDELLARVWGEGHGTVEALRHAIGDIRHVLGDHADNPAYIQTVPKRGYRLLAVPRQDQPEFSADSGEPTGFWQALVRHGVVQAVAAYLILGWLFIQVADATFANLGLPDWALPFVTFVVVGGVPLVALLSWFLEVVKGRLVIDVGEQPGSLWAGLGRNYLAVIVAYVIAAGVAAVYQVTVGFKVPSPTAELSQSAAEELLPIADNSVAVLRLMNIDGSDTTQVFSNGLSEDITDRLARVPGIRVASRGDSWSLSENSHSADVRRRLRVAYYLEGSARIDDGTITVVAQLVDSSNGFHVFSRPFSKKLAQFGEIQRELTTLIVSEIRVALPDGLQQAIGPPEDLANVDAYFQYRRGKDIMDQPKTAESIDRASHFFEEALAIDPHYAAAHAGLCAAYTARYELLDTTDDLRIAEQSCARALADAPRLPLVYLATGNLYFQTGRLAEAERAYQSALTFNDQDAIAMVGLAGVYIRQQKYDEAESLIRRAIELQPGNWQIISTLGEMQFDLGKFDEAVESYRRVSFLDPGNFVVLGNMASAMMMSGDFAGARDALQRSLSIEVDPRFLSNLGVMNYYLGDFDKSIEIHRQGIEQTPDSAATWINLADALYFAGLKKQATDAFETAAALARDNHRTDPTDAETLAYLAWAETMLGKHLTAAEHIERVLQIAPNDPYSHYYNALIALQTNQERTAMAAIRQSINLGYPVAMLKAEPYLASLRRQSEFANLLTHEDGEE